jgi:hypothetical protein
MQNNQTQSKTGLSKIIYDTSKSRSNIYDVEKQLNHYVQQRFTTLHDCIARRTILPIEEPVAQLPPHPALQQNPPPTPPVVQNPPPVAQNTGGHNRNLRSTTTSNVTDPPPQDAAPAPPLDQLPVVVPLVVPPAPAAIPFELEVAKYLEQYKIYLINKQTRNVELAQLFGIIDELLSTTSRERVTAHADYEAALTSRNGADLWNIVYSTHQMANMFHTPSQQMEAANKNYYRFHQPAHMPLETYYEIPRKCESPERSKHSNTNTSRPCSKVPFWIELGDF